MSKKLNNFLLTSLLLSVLSCHSIDQKPVNVAASSPIDISTEGNKLEAVVMVVGYQNYGFDIDFFYEDMRDAKYKKLRDIKAFSSDLKNQQYGYQEFKKILTYDHPVSILVDGQVVDDVYKYPTIEIPVHCTVIKFEENGDERLVFDKITSLDTYGTGQHYFKKIGGATLKPGIYKFSAEVLQSEILENDGEADIEINLSIADSVDK